MDLVHGKGRLFIPKEIAELDLGKLKVVVTEYVGDWFEGKKSGQGKQTSSNKNVYEGDFYDNFMQCQGTLKTPNGDIYTSTFVKNEKQG